ncbi:MAG: cell surface protein [Dehalococcoidia bacterium]|nr:cell surface protein [Dehalococcoidia bacterium]
MRYSLVAFPLLIGILIAGCAGPSAVSSGGTVSGNTLYFVSSSGSLVAMDASNGNRLWSLALEGLQPRATGGACSGPVTVTPAVYGAPQVDGDRIYAAGYSGLLYAVNATTRTVAWRYPREGRVGSLVGSPVIVDGNVFIGSSDGKVYMLDGVMGEVLGEFSTGGKVWATVAVADGILYVGSFDKKAYAFNIATKEKMWEFETGGAVAASPVAYEGLVYAGSFDRDLYAVGAKDGMEKWRFSAGNWYWGRPVAHKGVVYVPSLDHNVYALRAASGEKLAEFDGGSPVSSSPVVVGDNVVFATEKGTVYLIDTGTMGWRKLYQTVGHIRSPLFARNGVVYVQTQDRNLHAVEAQSGNKLWAVQTN